MIPNRYSRNRPYGRKFIVGDKIGMIIDFEEHTIEFIHNGESQVFLFSLFVTRIQFNFQILPQFV